MHHRRDSAESDRPAPDSGIARPDRSDRPDRPDRSERLERRATDRARMYASYFIGYRLGRREATWHGLGGMVPSITPPVPYRAKDRP